MDKYTEPSEAVVEYDSTAVELENWGLLAIISELVMSMKIFLGSFDLVVNTIKHAVEHEATSILGADFRGESGSDSATHLLLNVLDRLIVDGNWTQIAPLIQREGGYHTVANLLQDLENTGSEIAMRTLLDTGKDSIAVAAQRLAMGICELKHDLTRGDC